MASERSEQIASHRLSQLLAETSETIAEAANDTTLTGQATSYLRRTQVVLDHISLRLKATDPALVPVPMLDNAANALEQARAEIQNFVSNRDEGHLRNADHQIDNLLIEMRSLPPLPFRREGGVAAKAAEQYAQHLADLESPVRDALTRLLADIEAQSQSLGEVRHTLEDLKRSAEEKAAHVSAQADEKAAQVTAEADAKLAELRTEIDGQKARLDDAIAQYQSTFADAQEDRLKQFNEAQRDRETAFVERTDDVIKQAKSSVEEFQTEASSYVQSLQEHENRAAQIVGIAAASEVAGAYLEDANEQRVEADTWRKWAFRIAGVLFVGTIVSTALSPPGSGASVTELAVFASIRLPVASVIAGAFFYAIRQSGHHRDREQRAKHLAMQLIAFRPFLSELPQDQIPSQLVEASKRFFPGDEPPASHNQPLPS